MLLSLNWLKDYIDLPKNLSAKQLAHDLTMATVEVESIKDLANDVIFEIENKSLTNRPDLWNHYGVARELSTIYKIELKPLGLLSKDFLCHSELVSESENILDRSRNKPIPDLVSGSGLGMTIKIENKNLCPRYMGCVVSNMKVEKSPERLVKSLESVGMRAINNIVDITNYVMLDLGEPMHAFDLAKLGQNADLRGSSRLPKRGFTRIVIRKAEKGEKIKTLDGELRELDQTMLVIADNKKPIALAGVMGGANSEIDNNTTSIILEAANFDAVTVRRMSQKLNLRTEGSIRWEKSLDPNLAELGIRRALKLIKEIIPGVEIGPIIDVDYSSKQKTVIKVDHEFLERKIGQKFDSKIVVGILKRLGFGVETRFIASQKCTKYIITVPSWRATGDVLIPEDIVEEVARIYGYDNLKQKIEMVEMKKAVYQKEHEIEKQIKNYLSLGCGMNEVFNYPWPEEKMLGKLGILGQDDLIEIANPPAKENRFLQRSLIPNLIKNIENNLRYFDEFKIFELARVYSSVRTRHAVFKDKLPYQPKMLAGAVVVEKNKPARHASQGGAGGDVFLEVKGIIEGIVKLLNCYIVKFKPFLGEIKFINEDKSLDIIVGKEKIGWLAELTPRIYEQFNFKNKNVGLFEINFSYLGGTSRDLSKKKYQPLPPYPSIERDIAIEVNWKVKWGDIRNGILRYIQDDIIKKLEFLSEYDLGKKKSLAFRITYQSDRTLEDEEVEVVEKKIIKMLGKEFGAELRK